MTDKKIILELTPDQAYIVQESLELYARIRIGHDIRADRGFTINEVIRHFLHPDAYDRPMNWRDGEPMPGIRSE
jgi:hypothetical protein